MSKRFKKSVLMAILIGMCIFAFSLGYDYGCSLWDFIEISEE